MKGIHNTQNLCVTSKDLDRSLMNQSINKLLNQDVPFYPLLYLEQFYGTERNQCLSGKLCLLTSFISKGIFPINNSAFILEVLKIPARKRKLVSFSFIKHAKCYKIPVAVKQGSHFEAHFSLTSFWIVQGAGL